MNAQEAVRQQLSFWHGVLLGGMVAECGPQVLNQHGSNGTIGSIAAVYAHLVFSEDGIVHEMLQGKPRLYVTGGWEEKTGVPFPGPSAAMNPDWAKTVSMDIDKFQEYAKAVFADSEAYVAGLSDAGLDRKIQGPIGETTVGWVVVNLLGTHTPQHAGEIAALKGVHGLKGLPF